MKHIPALDGIRGIAILLVMLFHLKIPGLSLGWSGVPLFFVLSGFLITGILVEAKTEKFSEYLRAFYIKRTLRIFPLFYAYLALNFVTLLFSWRPTDGYIWYVLYLQNYHIGYEINRGGNLPGIVGHTWSLAVEEQFYLIWPFVVYWLNRKKLVWLCFLLIIISPISRWAILHSYGNVYMANVTLLSCLDMMAYGALLALLRKSEMGTKYVYTFFAIGCALLGYAVYELGISAFWYPQEWVNSAFYLFTALAFIFGMVIWSVTVKKSTRLVRLLTIRPLQFTGKISYGLYIWHSIIFLAVERLTAKSSVLSMAIVSVPLALVLTYVASCFSFYFFEIYFLNFKDRWVANKSSGGRIQN